MSAGPRLERGTLLDLLDEAVVVARAVFPRAFWGLALPPVAGHALLAALQADLTARAMAAGAGQSPAPALVGRWLGLVALGLIVAAVAAVAYAGMVRATTEHLAGRTPSAVDGWGWALSWPALSALLLAGLLVGGGLLLCALPGLYLLVVYGVMLPAAAAEGVGGYRALRRSRELVLHDPARRLLRPGLGWVLTVWATSAVLAYGVQLAIQLPLVIAEQLLMARGVLGQLQRGAGAAGPVFPGWFWALQAATATLASLARQLASLYSASAVSLLYLRLRARREGADIAAALDRLGAPG